MELVQQIVAFHMKHNAEPEAVDLLMEVEDIYQLGEYLDAANYKRTCMYLTTVWVAILLDNLRYVAQVFTICDDIQHKNQLCYILARHGVHFVLDESMVSDDDERGSFQEIINNMKLSEGYVNLARDIEVMEPKSPEDIYKTHLVGGGGATAGARVDSARQNLAATFVNAFVNAGFGQDKLMIPLDASSGGITGSWLFKNKEHGKASAAASLGMIFHGMWTMGFHNLIGTSTAMTPGALLGVGIVNSSLKHDCDPAMALLSDYKNKKHSTVRIGAIMGLGLTYAGTQNEHIYQQLSLILGDSNAPLYVIAFTAISLGLVFVGSCNLDVSESIILLLMERNEAELGDPLTKLLPVGPGLLYLGKQESAEATAEVSKTFHEKVRKYCDMTLLSCAYARTGNVLKIQHLLGECGQYLEKGETHLGPVVLGIAMVAMREEVGLDMAIRSLEHMLQYGDQNTRRAVALALGLFCISNPKVNVMDTLNKPSHNADTEVTMAATISLGLIGAGTNNAPIAGMLRNLSSYYSQDASLLFCVRIAQGLVHMGKGLLTLSPHHSERFLLSLTSLAGLIIMLHTCLDMKSFILDMFHYVLYFLALAMKPRMLMTLDENQKPLSVPVRVGQAIELVGQAGRGKTITGFQTHSAPVLLAAGDKAELAN
ncbi:hypothetical protein MKX01_002344 [Papaver californicum]|nr:hypothetical protein MKX01_002344 [Papaver californicum]